jgi:hypothetical protein
MRTDGDAGLPLALWNHPRIHRVLFRPPSLASESTVGLDWMVATCFSRMDTLFLKGIERFPHDSQMGLQLISSACLVFAKLYRVSHVCCFFAIFYFDPSISLSFPSPCLLLATAVGAICYSRRCCLRYLHCRQTLYFACLASSEEHHISARSVPLPKCVHCPSSSSRSYLRPCWPIPALGGFC